MNNLKCSDPGCTAVFQTEDLLHAQAKYTCRSHTPKVVEQRPQVEVMSNDLMEPLFFENPETGGFEIRYDLRKAKIPKIG